MVTIPYERPEPYALLDFENGEYRLANAPSTAGAMISDTSNIADGALRLSAGEYVSIIGDLLDMLIDLQWTVVIKIAHPLPTIAFSVFHSALQHRVSLAGDTLSAKIMRDDGFSYGDFVLFESPARAAELYETATLTAHETIDYYNYCISYDNITETLLNCVSGGQGFVIGETIYPWTSDEEVDYYASHLLEVDSASIGALGTNINNTDIVIYKLEVFERQPDDELPYLSYDEIEPVLLYPYEAVR